MTASSEAEAPLLPPLLSGEAAAGDPLRAAAARARAGCDAGLIVHRIRPDHLSAALVLAPEVPLGEAMMMVIAAADAFGDAFGALAPSEIACEFDWPGGFRINGARCGGLRAAAATGDAGAVPDWLVIGLELPFFAPEDHEPGETPDRTTLWEEGCAEITPLRMLESWSRHLLVWINTWQDEGNRRLLADWTGRAPSLGGPVDFTLAGARHHGQALGLDESGGLLLKTDGGTRLLPLTLMLEEA
jgi:biotin-(acetyl-CoA carboxylase) ligase